MRQLLCGLAASFDPATLSPAQCEQVLREATTIERVAGIVKAMAANRLAETGSWRRNGARSPEDDLARRTGTSVGHAREQLDTARRLRDQPKVDEAVRSGKLSAQQAGAVSDAAAVDPAAEGRLVEKAGRQSLRELRDECARVKAAATDPEERHRKIRASRRVRTFTDADGAFNLHLRDTPEVGAAVMEKLRPNHDRMFQDARREGRREPSEAYAADALVELILRDTATAGKVEPVRVASRAAKVIVRIDWDTLLRGYPLTGETCEIAGIGPVPVSVVEDLLATGDVFLAAVLTRGVDVINVAHLGRKATDHQVTGLQWKDPICPAEGCSAAKRLQIDHRHDWAETKITLLGWLDQLCEHHHRLKTRESWALIDGTGKRPMVPPDDPRHPRHAGGEQRQRGHPATGPPTAA